MRGATWVRSRDFQRPLRDASLAQLPGGWLLLAAAGDRVHQPHDPRLPANVRVDSHALDGAVPRDAPLVHLVPRDDGAVGIIISDEDMLSFIPDDSRRVPDCWSPSPLLSDGG